MMDNLQPIYRIEDFWYAIVNGLSCPHTPIYRIEQYLAYLCGADVEVPQPIYRIEQYLAYKCGLDVELPQPIYRQEMFLAKWCGMDVEPPTPIYRIEVLLSQLSNGELKTVTGNPISISDALAKPAESLSIEILPSQDLHGYDNPWPAGGGKNLLPQTKYQYTTTQVRLGGTTASEAYRTYPAGTYTLSVSANIGVSCYYTPDGGSNTSIGPNGGTFTLTEETKLVIYCYHPGELDMADVTKWQLEKGSSPTSWTPYSNICPITGFTGVNIWRTGKNLLDISKSRIAARGSFTEGDVTVTYNDDGTIRLQSSGSARTDIVVFSRGTGYPFQLPNGTYTFSIKGNESFSNYVHICASGSGDGLNGASYFDVASAGTTTVLDGSKPWGYLFLRIFAGGVFDITITLQVESGSTATAYEPYAGTTYSIDWTDEAGTVYGGTLDVTTGVLTVDRFCGNVMTVSNKQKDANGYYWYRTFQDFQFPAINGLNAQAISNRLKTTSNTATGSADGVFTIYASGIVRWKEQGSLTKEQYIEYLSANPLQFCYELATPITIQLTPTEIEMLLGNNVIWNDVGGDMALEYLADGPADDIDALQILLNNRYVNNGEPDEATDKEALEILLGGNTR